MKFKKHDLIRIEKGKEIGLELVFKPKYYCNYCKKYFKTKPKVVCETKIENKPLMGKHSRAAGKRFELAVRADLEKKGWIVCKWQNNVEFDKKATEIMGVRAFIGKLIPAKHIFNPFTKAMSAGNGFPDFVCFRRYTCGNCVAHHFGECSFNIILVESKMIGSLDKIEKDKANWITEMLKIPVFIASKEKKGVVAYEEFK